MSTSSFQVSEPLSRRMAERTIAAGAPVGQWLRHPAAPNPISLPSSATPFRNDTTTLNTVIAVIRDPPPRPLRRGEWVKLVHDDHHRDQRGSMVYPKVEWRPDTTDNATWMLQCEGAHALCGAIASPDEIPAGTEWTETFGADRSSMQHIGVMLTGINDLLVTQADISTTVGTTMYQQGLATANMRCIMLDKVPPATTTGRTAPVRALIHG